MFSVLIVLESFLHTINDLFLGLVAVSAYPTVVLEQLVLEYIKYLYTCIADGLWPDYNDGTWPACCKQSNFDEKEVYFHVLEFGYCLPLWVFWLVHAGEVQIWSGLRNLRNMSQDLRFSERMILNVYG